MSVGRNVELTKRVNLEKEAMRVLKETSRTFYIPITLLKRPLKLTVGSAYLLMRAIDEIEDHETMGAHIKVRFLKEKEALHRGTGDFYKNVYEELNFLY